MRRRPIKTSIFFCVALVAGIGFSQTRSIPTGFTPAKIPARFETKTMNPALVGEDTRILDHGILIHYMNVSERESHRVVILNGRVLTPSGAVFPDSTKDDKLNYVMDAAGNFFIFNQANHLELRHSSVFDGGPVAGAGEIKIKGDTVAKIDGNSGHYAPTQKMDDNVLSELKNDGVDTTGLMQK